MVSCWLCGGTAERTKALLKGRQGKELSVERASQTHAVQLKAAGCASLKSQTGQDVCGFLICFYLSSSVIAFTVFTDCSQVMSVNRRPSNFVIFSQVKTAGSRFLTAGCLNFKLKLLNRQKIGPYSLSSKVCCCILWFD